MARRRDYAARLEHAVDVGTAALAAVWPRSTEAEEIRRLKRAGYTSGSTCDVDFSLSFEGPAMAGIALDLVRAAGFSAADEALMQRGFVVVRLPLRLAAYDLALITLRLNRMVGPLGGFAAFIGPVQAGPSRSEATDDAVGDTDTDWYRAAS